MADLQTIRDTALGNRSILNDQLYIVCLEKTVSVEENVALLPSLFSMSSISSIVRNWIRKTYGFALKTLSLHVRWTFKDLKCLNWISEWTF